MDILFVINSIKNFLQKNSKAIDVLFIIILIYGGLIFISKTIDLSFLRSEIIAYPISCTSENVCTKSLKMTFTVNKNSQTIVRDIKYLGLSSFKNCIVKNRKNWECTGSLNTYPESYGTFGFKDGKYFSDSGRLYTYTSKLKYEFTPDEFKD